MLIAGDLGGTKALLLLARADAGRVEPVLERRYAASAFADFASMLARFIDECRAADRGALRIERACFGAAGPVAANRVQMTNLPWLLDGAELGARFGIDRVLLVNDFEAAAAGVDALAPEDCVELQAGEPLAQAPRVVLGAGTGLGVAYALPQGGGWRIISGEGGHAGFAPADATQARLWQALHLTLGRVSVEHVVSGPGLERIYAFLCAESAAAGGGRKTQAPAASIVQLALDGTDPQAVRTLDLFLACYGALAGDVALGVLARGGVYVAGGIARHVLERMRAGGFLAAFRAKGPHTALMHKLPLRVVATERLGLIGAAQLAAQSPA